jgi:hypothetical protein
MTARILRLAKHLVIHTKGMHEAQIILYDPLVAEAKMLFESLIANESSPI